MKLAACGPDHMSLEESDRIFFPGGTSDHQIAEARAVCATCPVAQQCRDFANNSSPAPKDGIWGGEDYRRDKNGKRPDDRR